MFFGNLLFDGALLVLAVLPLIFIYNRVYKDGVFGRIALSCICAASALLVLERRFFGNDENVVWMLLTVLVVGMATFLSWHLVRFHTRVVRGPLPDTADAPPPARRLRIAI